MTPTDAGADYAFWTAPGASFTVTYSLALFHEIDFQVNEGYRRIPHGGIETAGLLFGHLEGNSARIEAFRNIECEHSFGPSFVLSERDLTRLREQIEAAASDPELQGFQLLGWFIGHTRSPLAMNDRECALFDEFFAQPGKITLLIKPEKFQPTRFSFVVRRPDGRFDKNAAEQAIILPLAGRASRSADGPIPSIPAPVETPPARPAPKPDAVAAAAPPLKPEPARVIPPPRADIHPEPEKGSAPSPRKPAWQPAQIETLDEHLARIEARERAKTPAPAQGATPISLPSTGEVRTPLSDTAGETIGAAVAGHQRPTRKLTSASKTFNLGLVLVLLFAAALGCAVGYWAYLQLPSATITLNVHAEASKLLVSWPPDQTRHTAYAAIRVDDGRPVPLSPEEKTAGEAQITTTSDNVKIELTAQHWMRDSRGIVRFLKALPPPAQSPPAQSPPAQPEH